MKAVDEENAEMIQFLISKGANLKTRNYFFQTLLDVAVERKLTSIDEILLNNGFDTNIKNFGGGTPLIKSIFEVNPEIVKMLLTYGASLKIRDNKENTPLECALKKPNTRKPDLIKVIVFHQFDSIM